MQGSKTLSKTITTTRLKKANFRPSFAIFSSIRRQTQRKYRTCVKLLRDSRPLPIRLSPLAPHHRHWLEKLACTVPRRTSVATSLKATEFDGFSNTKHTNSWGKRTTTNHSLGDIRAFWRNVECQLGASRTLTSNLSSLLTDIQARGRHHRYMNTIDHILLRHPQWRHSGGFASISVTRVYLLCIQSSITTI